MFRKKEKQRFESSNDDKYTLEKMHMDAVKKQMEYLMLQSQINPHFLYNTLDSIRSEALKNKQLIIAEMIERLSKFFRYCISSHGNFVRLGEELNNVNDYFYIQKFRFEDRFELYTQIENSELLNYYIPKMTLQPIIENSISHGLEKKIEPGEIRLDIRSTEKKMIITVSDDGVGMSKNQLSELKNRINSHIMVELRSKSRSHGIALTNVNTRIHLCYGMDYGLQIRSMEGEGTQVEIVVPLVDDLNLSYYEQNNIGS